MEQLSWNKLVDSKLNSQKKLIYLLLTLLILSLSYIFYQATLFSDSLESLESDLDTAKINISNLQAKEKLTQDNLILVATAIGNLRNDLSGCVDTITDITDYLGDLSNNISISSRKNWFDNSNTYYLSIEEFNYGFYFSAC
jgi:cell division protein FtsL